MDVHGLVDTLLKAGVSTNASARHILSLLEAKGISAQQYTVYRALKEMVGLSERNQWTYLEPYLTAFCLLNPGSVYSIDWVRNSFKSCESALPSHFVGFVE
jgi:hypothetical protein